MDGKMNHRNKGLILNGIKFYSIQGKVIQNHDIMKIVKQAHISVYINMNS